MDVRYKDQVYTFPASLNAITLRQRIAFNEAHGKALDDMSKTIAAIKDEFVRETEQTQWHLENAARAFSFYTGIPFDEVRSEVGITDLLHVYNTDMQAMYKEETEVELKPVYNWKHEDWYLTIPELKPTDKMVLNEFIVSKEIVRALHDAGQGKWDTLPYLCAIYLRKKDEPFTEELVQEGSKRLALMQELPLDIAIAVGFFLTGTVNIYTTISQFSNQAEQKESPSESSLINGAG